MNETNLSAAALVERSGLRHIAFIMDGNGRWANARMLPREAGHKAGLRVVGVAWGYDENGAMAAAGPEWVIRHAGELATLVKNL